MINAMKMTNKLYLCSKESYLMQWVRFGLNRGNFLRHRWKNTYLNQIFESLLVSHLAKNVNKTNFFDTLRTMKGCIFDIRFEIVK